MAKVTFFSAVYWGKRLKDWNTMPKWSRFLRTSLSRWVAGSAASKITEPLTEMEPWSGFSRKFRHRSSVVLPEPEEPMMARACPCSRSKLMSSRTWVAPKCFSICCTSKTAMWGPPCH